MVLVGLIAVACREAPRETRASRQPIDPPAATGGLRSDTTLISVGSDSLVLGTGDDGATRIQWRRSGSYWTSGPTHGGRPSGQLVDVSGDGLLDLFWTLEYEEIVTGMLIFQTRSGARPIWTASRESCRVPQLVDFTADRRPAVLEYVPGALRSVECFGDALAGPCQELYPTEWVNVWIVQSDSLVVARGEASDFYRELAGRYRNAATSIRSALVQAKEHPARCNERMALALDSMADVASRK